MLKLLKSRAISIFLLVLCAVFVAVISLGRPLYSAYLEQIFIRRAAAADLLVSFDRLDASITRVRAARMDLQLPRYLMGVEFSEVEIFPNLFSLLLMRATLSFKASPYLGSLSGQITYSISADSTELRIAGRDLDISSHPQLEALGIKSGFLTFNIEGLKLQGKKPVSGRGFLRLENFSKPAVTTIYPGMFGSPLTIQIPAVPQMNMEASLNLENQAIDISTFKLGSSLGSISGKGVINLNELGNLTAIDLSSRFELSSEGKALVGGFLPLISSGRLSENSTKFDLSVSGSADSVKYSFFPLTSS